MSSYLGVQMYNTKSSFDWKKFRTEVVQVTPELATFLLERNSLNRPVKEYRVYKFAADIKQNRWAGRNGETIKFSTEGELLDGQHRLWAVVEAGVPVEMMVVFGLAAETRTTIDIGTTRSVADFFRMMDGVKNGAQLQAVIKAIDGLFTRQRQAMTYEDAKERYERFREGIDFAFKVLPAGRTKVASTPVRAAIAFAYLTNPAKVAEFALALKNGAGPNWVEGNPAKTARAYLLEGQTIVKDDQRTVALKMVTACHAYVQGHELTKLYAKEDAFSYFAIQYPEYKRVGVMALTRAIEPVTRKAGSDAMEVEIVRQARPNRPWARG